MTATQRLAAWLVALATALVLPARVAAQEAASASASATPAPSAPASAASGAEAAGPAASAAAPAAPSASPATPQDLAHTEQPRSFGHVLGDVLTQRVLLEHAGRPWTPSALPPADRVGRWFERRPPRLETDAEGRRWLVLEYQLINAPRALTTATLPALAIPAEGRPPLGVPAWTVGIAPLTGAEAAPAGGAWPLQADRPVMLQATRPLERQLQHASAALALVLLGWLAWWAWRQGDEARRLPFARAERRLRRLDPAEPAAWQLLHQALNHSAGHVVHPASLPRLFEQAPHLQPLRGELEAFFLASNARFFGAAPASAAFPLRALAVALRDAERRHQR